jgi:flagellar motor switch protein FliG
MALTGREKATIFLSILGSDVSSRVLRYLPEEIADLIASGINHLPTPSPQALSEVLDDYQGFLALPPPEAEPEPTMPSRPAAPRKSYAALITERPQTTAFLLSIMPEEDRAEVLQALPRERALIEELLAGLKNNPLRPKLEARFRQVFAGKVF